MMIASKAVSISITRLSPNPSSLMISACVLSIASCVVVPADISPTRFPMEVKNAFMIVTLFATNHSASPSRISIRNIDSNLISSFTSIHKNLHYPIFQMIKPLCYCFLSTIILGQSFFLYSYLKNFAIIFLICQHIP